MQDDVDGMSLPAVLAKMGGDIIAVDHYEGGDSTLVWHVEQCQPLMVWCGVVWCGVVWSLVM